MIFVDFFFRWQCERREIRCSPSKSSRKGPPKFLYFFTFISLLISFFFFVFFCFSFFCFRELTQQVMNGTSTFDDLEPCPMVVLVLVSTV